MGKKELKEILRKKKEEKVLHREGFSERKKIWIEHVEKFYEKVKVWLAPYNEEGLINIEYEKKINEEQYIGQYEIREMELNISDEKVMFKTIGTFILGAYGRIDMIGPKGKVIFLLVDSESEKPEFKVEIGIDQTYLSDYNEEEVKDENIKHSEKLEWKISTPPPNIQYFSLNGDSFSDSLIAVIHD